MDTQVYKNLLPFFIELETSTYCNRSCDYCPNALYARGKERRFIAHDLYLKIISDLRDIDYRGILALHNYNEPLLDPNIYERLREARILPGQIAIFTNGDPVNPAVLSELLDTGLNVLRITLHGKSAVSDILDKAAALGLTELEHDTGRPGTRFNARYGSLRVEFFIPDLDIFSTRGGILPSRQPGLSSRCYMPFNSGAIDCDGHLKICCDIYPADPLHSLHGLVGSLADSSFESLWFSPEMNALRLEVLNDRVTNPICLQCPPQSNVRGRRCAGREREAYWRKLLLT